MESRLLRISNILVATDFSDCSRPALERGRDLAAAFGATLHVLHVVSPPPDDVWLAFAPAVSVAEHIEHLKQDATARLHDLAAADLAAGLRVVTATALGDPVDEILTYAGEQAIDLIVCGTHGRRGWTRAMMGSVAEHLVRVAPCPVFTIRERAAQQPAA